jgi:hypothetical protein
VLGDIILGGFVVELVPIVRLKRRARLNVGGKDKPLHRKQNALLPKKKHWGVAIDHLQTNSNN